MNPDEFTLEEKNTDVGEGHTLYSQLWGSKAAKQTILFLHGGPGSGVNDGHKNQFDPSVQRVLFVDQRGSGKSTPQGSIKDNTTDKSVEDIVLLAKEYGIDSFVVTGGSWGSTLALVLAIRHPELVIALVLRGIFTARKSEIEYLDKGGIKAFFPDVWADYAATVPDEFKEDPGAFHGPRILGDDQVAAKESAYAYDTLEASVVRLDDRRKLEDFDTYDKNGITIEYSYLANACYLEEGYILKNADKIKAPLHIVQGRYDTVCPPQTAYDLHMAVPGSKLHWTVSGHSGGDRNNWETTRAILATLVS